MKCYKYCKDMKHSKHDIENFQNDNLFFSYVGEFMDSHEFEIITKEVQWNLNVIWGLDKYLEEYRKFRIRICSLCKNNNSSKMWSEYTENEKGFCLGYEIEDILNADKNIICGDTFYEDERPEMNEYVTPEELFRKVIFHKLKKYEYEEELRLAYIFPEELIEKVNFYQKVDDEHNVCYIPVPKTLNERPDYVRHVLPKIKLISVLPKELIIGKNCSDDDRKVLIEIATEKKIKVYER